MKIAYIAHLETKEETGVLKKISSQVRFWEDCGHEVKLFILSPNKEIWDGMKNLDIEIFSADKLYKWFCKFHILIRNLINWTPDLVYYRFNIYYPSFKLISKKIPIVLELNTDDLQEYKLSLSKHAYFYHSVTRYIFFNEIDGFVCVSKEIENRIANFNKPSITIGNGIDLSQFHPTKSFPNKTKDIKLVFIGSPGQQWHGVDKIIYLAKQFKKWHFDLIGIDDIEGTIPPNVKLHGRLKQAEYKSLITHADVAIGTLSLYRQSMHEASPLKTREYLAYGLPVIIAYQDTDFFESVPFILQIPNTRNNVQTNLNEIEKFVMFWKGRTVDKKLINHLHINYKEKKRLRFFTKVMNSSIPHALGNTTKIVA